MFILVSSISIQVLKTLEEARVAYNAPREAWCAAHLNMLCTFALDAYEQYGLYNDTQQRGFLIDYESLPGSIARVLLPSFGLEPSDHWLSKMAIESKSYSKGKGHSKLFFGDSEDKDQRATAEISKFSNSILQPTFEKMRAVSTNALKLLAPLLFEKIAYRGSDGTTLNINWKSLSDIPITARNGDVPLSLKGIISPPPDLRPVASSNLLRGLHSNSFKAKEFVSWAPFSNTHDSKAFEVRHR